MLIATYSTEYMKKCANLAKRSIALLSYQSVNATHSWELVDEDLFADRQSRYDWYWRKPGNVMLTNTHSYWATYENTFQCRNQVLFRIKNLSMPLNESYIKFEFSNS